jgi:hypothetical protein
MKTNNNLKKFTLFISRMSCAITLSAASRKEAIKYARHSLGLEEKDKIIVFGINL